MKRRCPVCGLGVDRTPAGRISQHIFRNTRVIECPGSYQPYSVALAADRSYQRITAQEVRELWWDEPIKPGPKSKRDKLFRGVS